jgi:hypothetical protein
MTAAPGRPRPASGQRADLTAMFTLQCTRCYRRIHGRGIGMECFGCAEAAKAVWPNAVPIAGEMSGS